ncbi:MAG: hypothetical protein FJ095_03510 [Deltaproteobacteria bacterium]|nr:hypothetical protein [Deltaproteobacteria bacterium]
MSTETGHDASRSSEPGGATARRSRPELPSAPSSRGSSPLGFEADGLFGEFGSLGDIPDLELLVQGASTTGGEAPSVSPEIEALMLAAATRARAQRMVPETSKASDLVVSAEAARDIEQLFEGGSPREGSTGRTSAPTPLEDATAPAPMSFSTPSARSGPASVEAAMAGRRSPTSTLGEPPPQPTALGDGDALEARDAAPRAGLRLTEAPRSSPPLSAATFEQRPTLFEALRPSASPSPHVPSSGNDAMSAIGDALRAHATGALVLRTGRGSEERHVVFRDGDIVTVDSSVEGETLLHVLVERGDVSSTLAAERSARLPRSGRHAAAALIAQGFVPQDALWTMLRAHAEWLLVRAFRDGVASSALVEELPERLASEPSVFGGATGVEVFVEVTKRALDAEAARERLGDEDARFVEGASGSLVHEAALDPTELELLREVAGRSPRRILEQSPEVAPLLAAMMALDILRLDRKASATVQRSTPPPAATGDLDDAAVRAKVATRLTLVRRGDYFALLGLRSDATGHELRQAYVALRRDFEPARLLTATTWELEGDVRLILDVVEEAYSVLADERRRARYRRAIEATPP